MQGRERVGKTYLRILWEWPLYNCSIVLFYFLSNVNFFVEDELAELVTGEDVEIIFNERNFLEYRENRETFKEALQDIGRDDLATKFEIYLATGK